MRAFKKLMAGAIATAIAATMATSAFAAGFDADTGLVNVDYEAEGQTTVLIVPADVWVDGAITGLANDDILYINQYETAGAANTAIAAGFGVKLNDEGTLAEGDYYALFGGNVSGSFAITAVPFKVGADEPVIVLGDLTGDGKVLAEDGTVMAQILAGMISLTEDLIKSANVDTADGILTGAESVNAADGTTMAKYLAGMISSFN